MTSSLPSQPASLQEAIRKSTLEWQANLKSLFKQAKDRFPDVVWQLTGGDDYEDKVLEEVWGHKAILYARAPPSFQTRYFSLPRPSLTPPYSSPPSVSAGYNMSSTSSFTDEDLRVESPAPSAMQTQSGNLLRIRISHTTLFSNELEFLYTGQGLEEFEFIYESESLISEPQPEGDAQKARIDKLRKDLIFMWRSFLYSDVHISLAGNFSSSPHGDTTAVFFSHRFILVSRCSYLFNALMSWSRPVNNEPFTLSLPSPPFTPSSLHFTLGFIYTGTLSFSNRSYDLNTAFAILRSASYLSMITLYEEVQARIIEEMMHGLFHAFLSFPEYERITWGSGGCRCRQCARRAPRVLEFAIAEDVKNPLLERGARRALVGLFGEGWCTSEFASLSQELRRDLLNGLRKRTTPENVFPLLFAAENALAELDPIVDPWADTVREMIEAGRRGVDEVLCDQADACFVQSEWLEIMQNDGVIFEDGKQVELVMKSVLRGVNDKNAAMLYQTLVGLIILRPSAEDPGQSMLSTTSHIRIQTDQTIHDLISRIDKQWLNIRNEGGFDDLDGWAIEEISFAIDVAVEELLMPKPNSSLLHVKDTVRDRSSDAASIRISVPSRSLHSKRLTTPIRGRASDVASSSASVFSSRSSYQTAANVLGSTSADNVESSLNTALVSANLSEVSTARPRTDSRLNPPDTSLPSVLRTPTPKGALIVIQEDRKGIFGEYDTEETRTEEQETCEGSDSVHEDISNLPDRSNVDSGVSSATSRPKILSNKIVITPYLQGDGARSFQNNDGRLEPPEYKTNTKQQHDENDLRESIHADPHPHSLSDASALDIPLQFSQPVIDHDGSQPVNSTDTSGAQVIHMQNYGISNRLHVEDDNNDSGITGHNVNNIGSPEQRFMEPPLPASRLVKLFRTCFESSPMNIDCSDISPDGSNPIDLTDYINRGTCVASGGFGHVYKGTWKNNIRWDITGLKIPPHIAVKVINIPILDEDKKNKRLKNIQREAQIWGKMNHDNILPLVGIARIDGDSNLPAFVSPWMQNGSVTNFLKENPSFPAVRFLPQIIKGLHYLHTLVPEIIHGDIKAANVLVNRHGEACLCDFGLSRFVVDNTLWRTTATHANGTVRWMSPELLEGDQVIPTRASDIYAYGMTCYEILCGRIPFEAVGNDFAVMTRVLKGMRPEKPQDAICSDHIWSVITRCWDQDPKNRPSTEGLMALVLK